jgi:predicted molibdopterin-dependent oxidoreductase YjgC
MFRRLPDDTAGSTVTVTVDGERHAARAGDTVAAVLLTSSLGATRVSPVSGQPRAPYCMMGVCFECLVTIDGVGNRQSCLVPVADGMRIETQKARREAGR